MMTAGELEAEALRREIESWTCPRDEREQLKARADELWEMAAEARKAKRKAHPLSLAALWWRMGGRRGDHPSG